MEKVVVLRHIYRSPQKQYTIPADVLPNDSEDLLIFSVVGEFLMFMGTIDKNYVRLFSLRVEIFNTGLDSQMSLKIFLLLTKVKLKLH